MKIFTIYASDSNDKVENAKYIQDGFSISALIFSIFWFLYHRMWLQAVIFAVIYLSLAQLTLVGMLSPIQNSLLNLVVSLYIGMTAREYYAKNLERSGYYLADIITASDIDDAEYKYISRIYEKINKEIEELVDEKADHSPQKQ